MLDALQRPALYFKLWWACGVARALGEGLGGGEVWRAAAHRGRGAPVDAEPGRSHATIPVVFWVRGVGKPVQ